MNLLADNSLLLLERSMGFLWTKQRTILDNISNSETPRYKAKVVTFEEELRAKMEKALASAKPRHAVEEALGAVGPVVTEAQESARADGNGVNLTDQFVELTRAGYQSQYVMSAINTDLAVLRSAVRGQ